MAYQDLGIRFVVLGFGELTKLNNTLATTERSIKSMSHSLSSWGSSISNVGQKLTASVTVPVLAMGAGIAKAEYAKVEGVGLSNNELLCKHQQFYGHFFL